MSFCIQYVELALRRSILCNAIVERGEITPLDIDLLGGVVVSQGKIVKELFKDSLFDKKLSMFDAMLIAHNPEFRNDLCYSYAQLKDIEEEYDHLEESKFYIHYETVLEELRHISAPLIELGSNRTFTDALERSRPKLAMSLRDYVREMGPKQQNEIVYDEAGLEIEDAAIEFGNYVRGFILKEYMSGPSAGLQNKPAG